MRVTENIFLDYDNDDIEKYISTLKQFYASVDPALGIDPFPESYYKRIMTKYGAMKKQEPISIIKRYKVDYILIGNEAAAKLIRKYTNKLNIVYKNADYTVFKLI